MVAFVEGTGVWAALSAAPPKPKPKWRLEESSWAPRIRWADSKTFWDTDETERRFAIFRANLQAIDTLNARNPHATFGITRFADRPAHGVDPHDAAVDEATRLLVCNKDRPSQRWLARATYF